jgi:hypothetical protein
VGNKKQEDAMNGKKRRTKVEGKEEGRLQRRNSLCRSEK